MRALKRRLRPDNIPSEQRVTRGSAGRIIYLALLGIFTLVVLDYFFGDYFAFRADGLVLRDQSVVATAYIARVESIDVREGQTVERGNKLLKLQSMDILERLADLSTKRAELVAKATDFRVRMETSALLLPLAERREAEAERVIKQFDGMSGQGLITSSRYEEALRAQFEARREHSNLAAESRVLKDQMSALDAALSDADTTLEDLQTLYAGGLVQSPVSGAVGATIPSIGNVYRPGEPLLTVYFGQPYVLVYLPRRYLFPVDVGMKLKVTDGQHTMSGIIDEILPVTDTLPKEFQNTFQPSDRNQLAKIKLDSGTLPFPLLQKVRVVRPLSALLETAFWRDMFGAAQVAAIQRQSTSPRP
jgi:multidrug resistance efflux pump